MKKLILISLLIPLLLPVIANANSPAFPPAWYKIHLELINSNSLKDIEIIKDSNSQDYLLNKSNKTIIFAYPYKGEKSENIPDKNVPEIPDGYTPYGKIDENNNAYFYSLGYTDDPNKSRWRKFGNGNKGLSAIYILYGASSGPLFAIKNDKSGNDRPSNIKPPEPENINVPMYIDGKETAITVKVIYELNPNYEESKKSYQQDSDYRKSFTSYDIEIGIGILIGIILITRKINKKKNLVHIDINQRVE